jgi:hypothetical protein
MKVRNFAGIKQSAVTDKTGTADNVLPPEPESAETSI